MLGDGKIYFMMKKNSFCLCLVLSCLLAFSVLPAASSVTVTPLLDTPDNMAYYDVLLSSIKDADDTIQVLMATADRYPDYPNGPQNVIYRQLSNAVDRGVTVNVLLDSSDWSTEITSTNTKTAAYLRNLGVKVKFDDPGVTTHAKMAVFDEDEVILGSSNWNYPTYKDTYQTGLLVESIQVGRYFSRFFTSLWNDEPFNRIEITKIPRNKSVLPLVSYGDSRTYFKTAEKVIDRADQSIDLVLFKLATYQGFSNSSSNQLLNALVAARNRGVDLRIILDVNTWSDSTNETNRETALWLLGKGVEAVRFDSMEHTTHAKALIVDGEDTLIGSTNWAYYSLSKNTEVDILIHDSPAVGNDFREYFETLWGRAKTPTRKELSGKLW